MRKKAKILAVVAILAMPAAAVGIGYLGESTTGLAPESMRAELSRDIVQRWSPYVEKEYGKTAQGWGQRMQSTLREADIANLEAALGAPTFVSMNAALLGNADAAGPATGKPKSLGSPGMDLVYTPLSPCRIVDTRVAGGPIAANSTRAFRAFTATDFAAQGGDLGNCSLPQNVSAITVKITSVFPSADGYFTAYPFDETRPLASSLNYTTGMIVSDESHIRLCRPGCMSEFNVYSYAQSQVVIDVTGYFAEPQATALDCVVAQQTGNLDLLGGLQARSVACPSGYTATGGGCGGVLGIAVSNSEPQVMGGRPVGWQCDLVGSLLSVISYKVNATCCRVPGR
jgi:hypothetical protein